MRGFLVLAGLTAMVLGIIAYATTGGVFNGAVLLILLGYGTASAASLWAVVDRANRRQS